MKSDFHFLADIGSISIINIGSGQPYFGEHKQEIVSVVFPPRVELKQPLVLMKYKK